MKNCKGCKYAEWKRTKNNRLHPGGKGICKYKCKLPVIPASMSWSITPKPRGGHIYRHKDHIYHCLCYDIE